METAEKAVGSIVQFFEKLITDFSWRRLGFVVALFFLVGLALVVQELYTQSFRLTRLNREAALLERVLALEEAAQGSNDQDLAASLDGLKRRLRDVVQLQPEGEILTRSTWKVLYALFPWMVVFLMVLLAPGPGGGTAILGVSVIAVPLIVLTAYLPEFQHAWINNWLIPWAEVLLVIVCVLAWQRLKTKDAG